MDKRFEEISLRLSEYSMGNFNKRIHISSRRDEIDAISNVINMLGEELRATTVGRDYFKNVFNSVSDMVFILNIKGIIKDANKSAESRLKYEAGSLLGKKISSLQKRRPSDFRNKLNLKESSLLTDYETFFETSTGEIIPVRINVSHFNDNLKNQFIILTAIDTTFQINLKGASS